MTSEKSLLKGVFICCVNSLICGTGVRAFVISNGLVEGQGYVV